ncbi:MAG: hypothetical protein UV78_C0033G0004 [Parcubacteria group bacterium GW2011_GWA2_43_17]|nr:MAG: hypothetical protein UV78_C0033G0004 [Parcubacteria group bacterium GW2011_GWA2_43_17]
MYDILKRQKNIQDQVRRRGAAMATIIPLYPAAIAVVKNGFDYRAITYWDQPPMPEISQAVFTVWPEKPGESISMLRIRVLVEAINRGIFDKIQGI